jgi:hypothetical protein
VETALFDWTHYADGVVYEGISINLHHKFIMERGYHLSSPQKTIVHILN